jgi:hypothetical protein
MSNMQKSKSQPKGFGVAMATNMFGHLRPEVKSALYNFIQFPNRDNWDEIYSIVISNTGKTRTVWQAVIALDPTFNVRVYTDAEENRVWPKVPTAELVSRAILNANVIITLN